MSVSPQNSYAGNLTPKDDAIRMCDLWRLSGDHEGGAIVNRISVPDGAPSPLSLCGDMGKTAICEAEVLTRH